MKKDGDTMNGLIIKENEKIEDMIYEIRGKQVMLDRDLAKLYECTNGTKDVNKAVNRNIERFPKDFYFQLTKEEYDNLKFQFGTSRFNNHGGVRKLPYVFTEQGVAMLSSVLKTSVASSVSVDIMRAFVTMKRYIGNNEYRLSNIETKILEHDNSIHFLKETFQKLDEKRKVNEIYFDGQIFDAYSKIQEIFAEAKKQITIIDAYADYTLLNIIKRLNVNVTIITRKDCLLTSQDILKYNQQYHNLKVVYDHSFHDRYFVLDSHVVYHCGASVNRIGHKTFSITLICDKDVCDLLISKIQEIVLF